VHPPIVSLVLLKALLFCLLSASGCATVPYERYPTIAPYNPPMLHPGEEQFERGRPHKVLDTAGWIWGIPSKILLWNLSVDNHRISESTEETLRTYLRDNGLDQVKVRLNAYSMADEWARLFRNRSVGAGWRYTLGVLTVAMYTALPGRFFGGDHYNPYTHTLNIYSDHQSIVIHEGAHAKDFSRRKYRGTYAAIRNIPGVPLYQEAVATNDALGYLKVREDVEAQKDGYKILYPAYSTYIGGAIAQWLPSPYDYAVAYGVLIRDTWRDASLRLQWRRTKKAGRNECPPGFSENHRPFPPAYLKGSRDLLSFCSMVLSVCFRSSLSGSVLPAKSRNGLNAASTSSSAC